MTESARAFNPGPCRPRPEGRKPRHRVPGAPRKRLVFLLSLLVTVAFGAWIWYRWIGPSGQAQIRERLRPAGTVSIQPAR